MSEWIVLTMANRATLPLVESLRASGFDVWAPVETRIVKVPRANVRREVRRPIMAGFVFARRHHLAELDALASAIHKRHQDFRIFRPMGATRFVPDAELQPLRVAETKAVPLAKLKPYARGDRVPGSGAFAGMSGIVEGARGQYTLVCFDGKRTIKIPTFILRADDVGTDRPSFGRAA